MTELELIAAYGLHVRDFDARLYDGPDRFAAASVRDVSASGERSLDAGDDAQTSPERGAADASP